MSSVTARSPLQIAALVFGVVFLAVGVLGFVPGITTTDSMGMKMLLGVFMVGGVHNVIHLASGALGILASTSIARSRLYLLGFGAVYALVTLIGFVQGDTVLGIIDVNLADNLLHLGLAVALLALGLLPARRRERRGLVGSAAA